MSTRYQSIEKVGHLNLLHSVWLFKTPGAWWVPSQTFMFGIQTGKIALTKQIRQVQPGVHPCRHQYSEHRRSHATTYIWHVNHCLGAIMSTLLSLRSVMAF